MTVFLDEAQNLDCFKSLLNGYIRKPNLDLYFSGSNPKFLFQDVIKEFAGRGGEISMHPLSLPGFTRVYPGNVYRGFSEYLIYGGIPSVALENDTQERADLLRSLFREIYRKGINQRNAIRKSGGDHRPAQCGVFLCGFADQSGETEERLPDLEKQQYLFYNHQTMFGYIGGHDPDRALRTT